MEIGAFGDSFHGFCRDTSIYRGKVNMVSGGNGSALSSGEAEGGEIPEFVSWVL